MDRKSLVVLSVALLAVAIVPAAQAGLVTCRTGSSCLNGNDSYDWTTNYGPAGNVIHNNSTSTSNAGVTVTVNFSRGGDGHRLDQGDGWSGNFTFGDELLETIGNGPLNFINFSHTLFGIGANIQPANLASFTAALCDGNGMCVLEKGHGNNDGSAIFIGLTDSAGFTRATFSVVACSIDCLSFAINQLDIVVPVPESSSMLLLSSGLLGAIAYGRRRLGV
jgi:hypothetical protein